MATAALNPNPQVRVSPQEDARLPIYREEILHTWKLHAPKKYRELMESKQLETQAQDLALQCVKVLHQYQEHGLNPDQGREAARALITDSLNLPQDR